MFCKIPLNVPRYNCCVVKTGVQYRSISIRQIVVGLSYCKREFSLFLLGKTQLTMQQSKNASHISYIQIDEL